MLTAPRPIQDQARRHGVSLAVALILLISAAFRLWQLSTPAEKMVDEIYYAKDAKAIVDNRVGIHGQYRWAAGDEVSWPHPEMGKIAIAAGVLVFGDRAFGWRIASVVAGIALLACVYPLGRRLGLSPPWALLALLFAAADPLDIAMSRIAMLDIFIALWTIVCVLFALRYVQEGWRPRWLFVSGIAGGMAVATKWSGALAILAALLIIAVAWLAQRHAAHTAEGEAAAGQRPQVALTPPATFPLAETDPAAPPRGSAAARIGLIAAALVAVPFGIYMLSYTQYFIDGHTLADFRELVRQMWIFNFNLHAEHQYASPAYTWILDYRPWWNYFVGEKTYHGILVIGNPFLWWLATLSLAAAVVLAVLRRSYALLPTVALVAILYLPWLATSRTSFIYYMTPVAPVLAVLVAGALCLFARGAVPRRGWIVAAGVALATAVLWDSVAVLATRVARSLGWTDGVSHLGPGQYALRIAVICVVLALAVAAFVLWPRMKRFRPWTAMVIAGLVIGIVVAFVPVLLGLGISPGHFSHIMWFPSWI